MDMILNVLFGLIKTGNYIPAIIVVLILIGLVIYKYTNIFKPRDLTTHGIFMNFEEFNHKLCYDSSDKPKVTITKRFLKIYIKNIRAWLVTLCVNQWNGEIIIKGLNESISNLYSEARDDGVPEIFIEKFKVYNETTMNMIYKYVKVADSSDFYESEESKKLLIMTMVQSFFYMTIQNTEDLCNSLNGELEKALENM